jgi:hypothetical protein
MTLSFPPIRPSRMTRLANRLGLTRTELMAGVWATLAGAPIAATVVILATVPVPQDPEAVAGPTTETPSAVAPLLPVTVTADPPSPLTSARPRAERTAPRVIAPAAGPEPSTARTEPGPEPFADCDAARQAGRANIPRGDPRYAPRLDRDGNGVGCQTTTAADPPPRTTAPAVETTKPGVPTSDTPPTETGTSSP